MFSFLCLFLSSANSSLDERLFTDPPMTSINVLGLPPSVKDTLLKGKESLAPAFDKKVRPLFPRHCLTRLPFFLLGAASLDTVEDLLLYTPPGLSNDVPSARYKRQQVAKGVPSGSYDRLMSLTPSEIAFAYDQAAAHIFENKIAYGSAHDLLQDESWLDRKSVV